MPKKKENTQAAMIRIFQGCEEAANDSIALVMFFTLKSFKKTIRTQDVLLKITARLLITEHFYLDLHS